MKLSDLDILLTPALAPEPAGLSVRWGTVAQVSPLRVRLDGPDAAPLPVTPTNLAGRLAVGDPVVCLLSGRHLIVVGAPMSLVEHGSSVNGTWIQTPDGTMICTVSTSASVSLSEAYGSLWVGAYTWTFPQSFLDPPVVSCARFQWSSGASWGTVRGVSPTAAELRGIDAHQRAAGPCQIAATAIGRWR